MIHTYLFFKVQDRIKTFHFRDQHFELIRFKGNETSSLSEDFWTWWGKTASYIQNQDMVDFCFLSNDENWQYDLSSYETVTNSSWNLKEVKQFCQANVHYSNINLLQNGSFELITLNGDHNEKIMSQQFTLYVQVFPNKTIIQTRSNPIDPTLAVPKIEKKESDLSTYYREITKSYQ